jgi:hypothetical protein
MVEIGKLENETSQSDATTMELISRLATTYVGIEKANLHC